MAEVEVAVEPLVPLSVLLLLLIPMLLLLLLMTVTACEHWWAR
jgi:hypothetical protein